MSRIAGSVGFGLVAVRVVAHLLDLGRIRDAAEATVAWLRFVLAARTSATVVGCALVVVGLLHDRDTEPRGEAHWIVLGVVVLALAAPVHRRVVRARRVA